MSSVYGIDVSSFNTVTDWQLVKTSGNKEFCIIQAGNDNTGQNSMLMTHYNGCVSAGIDVGLYWFCYALTPQAAFDNGALCGQIIQRNNLALRYPVYYDVEATGSYENPGSVENWINNGINPTPAFVHSIIEGFAAGLASEVSNTFGVYFNQSMYYQYGYATMYAAHPGWSKWVAQWDPYPPTSWTNWDIWQYGEGSVPGHVGRCDLDVLYEGYDPPGPGPTAGKMPFWMFLKYPF